MILYHGSMNQFSIPDLNFCKSGKDFGKGLYLTPDKRQAVKWAKRTKENKGYLYTYHFDFFHAKEELNCLELLQYNKKWADYIVKCRLEYFESMHDLVYDRMADSKYTILSSMLEKYYYQKVSLEILLTTIRFCNHYRQYCLKTQKALAYLSFRDMEEI